MSKDTTLTAGAVNTAGPLANVNDTHEEAKAKAEANGSTPKEDINGDNPKTPEEKAKENPGNPNDNDNDADHHDVAVNTEGEPVNQPAAAAQDATEEEEQEEGDDKSE